MGEWITRRLREIGEMCGAGADKLSKAGEKPVRLVNYMDVYRHHRITGELPLQEVTATDHEITRYDLRLNDVLFTPSSETPDDIANAAVVGEDIPGAVYSYHLNRFRAHQPEAFDTDFLGYLFNSSQVQRYFWARASGLTRYTLNRSDFKNLPLFFPKNRKEQSAISTAIGSVDSAIAAARESIAKAERLQKALMQQLLTGRMRPDGSMRGKGEFWTHPKLGLVPKGWEVKKVSEVCENLDSQRRPIKKEDRATMQGRYPYYGAVGIVDWVNSYIFDGDFILFGEDGENLVSRRLPQTLIARGKFWVNNHAHILKVIEPNSIEYVCAVLGHRDYRGIVYGSAQPKLNKSDLMRILIQIPPPEEQKELSDTLRSFESLIAAKQTKIGALQRLKKALMQSLLTGRIRLPVEGEEDSHAETRRPQREKA